MSLSALRTILVIDPDALHRDRIVAALEAAGYRAITVGDDEDAIARIDADRPALIVVAWATPLVRGLQLFDALAEPRRADIPVVVLAEGPAAARVPAHAAAVLGLAARRRTLLDVIARLSGAAAPSVRLARRRRRTFARASRIVTRTLVDVDSAPAASEGDADTIRFDPIDHETVGPT
jgi:CheY-like chemotaxis protein